MNVIYNVIIQLHFIIIGKFFICIDIIFLNIFINVSPDNIANCINIIVGYISS